ncbi:hypothetical protein Tco_0320909 [Tanacetum coccineum]
MYVNGRVDIFDMADIDLFTVVALNMMAVQLDYIGETEPLFVELRNPMWQRLGTNGSHCGKLELGEPIVEDVLLKLFIMGREAKTVMGRVPSPSDGQLLLMMMKEMRIDRDSRVADQNKKKGIKHEDEPFMKDDKLSKKGRTITCQSYKNIGHNKATCKGQGQKETTVMVDGEWVDDPCRVKEEFRLHFANRFRAPAANRCKLNYTFPNRLSSDQLDMLESPISRDECVLLCWAGRE